MTVTAQKHLVQPFTHTRSIGFRSVDVCSAAMSCELRRWRGPNPTSGREAEIAKRSTPGVLALVWNLREPRYFKHIAEKVQLTSKVEAPIHAYELRELQDHFLRRPRTM